MSAVAPVASSCPIRLGAEHHRRLGVIANRLERSAGAFVLPEALAPSGPERAALAERRTALAIALRPAGKRIALERITTLSMMMKGRGGDGRETAAWMSLYVEVLKDIPLFALDMACNDFLSAKAGDGEWLPPPGKIVKQAELYWRPFDREGALLACILDARVLPRVDRGTAAERKAAVARILVSMRPRPELAREG